MYVLTTSPLSLFLVQTVFFVVIQDQTTDKNERHLEGTHKLHRPSLSGNYLQDNGDRHRGPVKT